MNYKDRIFGRRIFNPVSDSPCPGGLHQYIHPATEELAGRRAAFRFDEARDCAVSFTDGKRLIWRDAAGETERDYTAVKADDSLYLVVVPFYDNTPAALYSLLFDRDMPEATLVVSTVGHDPDWPRLVRSVPVFGEKLTDGEPPTGRRQGFTSDLVGRRVLWQYTPNDAVLHIFPLIDRQRLGRNNYYLAPGASLSDRENYERHVAHATEYPFYEEPAFYIRLKEGMYLYSVIESNGYHAVPSGYGSELVVVLDEKRARYIGRTFGLTPENKPNSDIVGAPGRFTDEPDEVEAIPCPHYFY